MHEKRSPQSPYSCCNHKGDTDLDNTAHRADSPTCSLASKVPGGRISVTRRYENNRWQWGEERERLTLKRETIYSVNVASPGSVLQIEKAGVLYNRESSLQPIFLNETCRITALGPGLSPTGYRFEEKENRYDHKIITS